MANLLKRITSLFVCVLILFTAVHFPVLAVGDDEETPSYTVEQVIDLLEQIDSLQEMQDKRKTEFAATKRAITSANFATNDFDEEALAEHQALAAAYEAYIDNMFELRAQAKAAYDSLDAAEAFVINARRKRLGED